MSFIGSLISAQGAKEAGKRAQMAYKYNASINEQNATAIRTKSDWEESQSREKNSKLRSTQRALYAKANVDLSSGSPLLVLAETAGKAEAEAQAIRWGGDVAVAEQRNMATLNRFYGKTAKKAGDTQSNAYIGQAVGQAGETAMNIYKIKG